MMGERTDTRKPTASAARRNTPGSRDTGKPGEVSKQILARKEQAARPAVFPDLRNIGIMARALVIYVGLILAAALVKAESPESLINHFGVITAATLPLAAFVSIIWAGANSFLRNRLAYWQAGVLIAVVTAIGAYVSADWVAEFSRWQLVSLSLLALTAILTYLHTLGRALSPAVSEARLQALQARIRPHFLFNSINGVMGILRTDPRRAEAALQDMADLFRVLMKENRELKPLHDEVVLTRQYLDLEKLRLGNRLNVSWKLDKMPTDAQVPPLVLQPIAENAVYYGVEPNEVPATIEIEIYRLRAEVHLFVKNPYIEAPGKHHGGNKMAMENIRERLALHFDAEARMSAAVREQQFVVHIVMPYRKPDNVKNPV